MLGRNTHTARTNRPSPAPSATFGELVQGFLKRALPRNEQTQENMLGRVTAMTEELSHRRLEQMRKKEAVDKEIYALAVKGLPTKQKEQERAVIARTIKGLDSRLSAVVRNQQMVQNVEIDSSIASLIGDLNVYMAKQTKEGTDVSMLEDLMDDQEEYLGQEEERNSQFDAAFENYNQGIETDIEEDVELAQLKERAAAEREILETTNFPTIAAAPSASRPIVPSPQPAKRMANAWDEGW